MAEFGGGLWFWVVAGLMAFGVAVYMLRAMARADTSDAASPAAKALVLYRAQLDEIERDLAKGTLEAAEAERLRTEVQRRILDAARMAGAAGRKSTAWGANLGLISVMAALVGALGTYTWLGAPGYSDLPLAKRLDLAQAAYDSRPNQDQAEAMVPASPPLDADPDFVALIAQLRAALAQRPDDITGLTLLARNEAQLGNYTASRRAYEALIAAKGADTTAEDYLGAAQAMIAAAGGTVTPQAEAALMQTLALDAENGLARYFSGLMFAQTGRPDRAFALWEPLLREGPADAPWIPAITDLLPEVAEAAGINYTMPRASAQVAETLGGPTAEDMAAASDMTEDERRVMINTMVTGLEARLLETGGTSAEWVRLVSSLAILGETGRLRVALAAGEAALAGDDAALAALRQAAGAAP